MSTLAPAATEQTLYTFPSSGSTGCYPDGTLIRDAAGALYGATLLCGRYNQGTVFKLIPPAPGQTKWSISLLYVFRGGNDGGWPSASLVMDTGGVLYGTAEFSGQNLNGVVYKLTPSPGTTRWTETVLHDFSYNFATGDEDGANPAAGVFMDTTGALYGTTVGGGKPNKSGAGFGTVFELKPPIPGETKWTEYVLYRFAGGRDGQSPESALIADGAGALYGTTLYGGKGPCTDSSAIVVGCGTVFKLSPPSPGNTRWTKTTLYRFAGGIDGGLPHGVLRLDGFGRIYGTTFGGGNGSCSGGCGTAFRLTPPPAGQTAWTKSVIYNFKGADGAFPQGGLIADGAGNLYGTASGGGTGDGVVFKLIPPGAGQPAWTEIVLHNFNISTSGKTPLGELVADRQRHLFGVAYDGGRGLVGTVFGVTR